MILPQAASFDNSQMTNCARRRVYPWGMEIVYVDRFFMLNLLSDYLLCLVSARVCGLVLKRLRYLLAALLGALYAAAALLPGLRFLSSAPGVLLCALAMALIAFGAERRPLRCGGVFLAVSAAFGGAVWAVSLLSGAPPGAVVSGRVLLLAFALCYAAVSLLFSRRLKLAERARVEVRLRVGARESRFMALLDSGNALADPVTGAPVMLVSPHALLAALPEAALFGGGDPVSELQRAARIPALAGRFRLIPYAAVGAAGLLPVFRPDGLTVDGREEKELLVAVSPSASGEGFEAIV